MKSTWSQFLAAIFISLCVVAPASAITGNFVKDFEHPFVGLAVFYDKNGVFAYRCSGTLLTPVVFLTAGHCAGGGGVTARVYFQQDAGAHFDPVTEEDPLLDIPTRARRERSERSARRVIHSTTTVIPPVFRKPKTWGWSSSINRSTSVNTAY
jgi:hypothetical protein